MKYTIRKGGFYFGVINMKKNLQHNYFWFIKSLETYGLGIYFIILHSSGTFSPPGNVLEYLDDPPFIFLLAVAATVAMVYTLWNVHHLLYKPLMTGLLTFVWLIFLCGFAYSDWYVGRLSFQTMYSFFIVASMVGQIMIKKG